jgi:hypothetical protein
MENYTYEEVIINDVIQCIARSDGAMIPLVESNSDYQVYLKSLEEGSN